MPAHARTQPIGLRKWTDATLARQELYQERDRFIGLVDEQAVKQAMGGPSKALNLSPRRSRGFLGFVTRLKGGAR